MIGIQRLLLMEEVMELPTNIVNIFEKSLVKKKDCLYIKESFKISDWMPSTISNTDFSFQSYYKRLPYFSLKLNKLCGNNDCLDPEHMLETTKTELFPEPIRNLHEALQYYEENGYPFTKWNSPFLETKLNQILSKNLIPLNDYSLGLNNTGVSLANAFHPQMEFVSSSLYMSPMTAFEDRKIRNNLIEKVYSDTGYVSDNNLRRALFNKSKVKKVSNFNPLTAKYIYDLLKPKLVLDFSMGWGGRMLGAIASGVDYIGVDPSTFAINGNTFLLREIQKMIHTPNVTLIKNAAEDVLGKNTFSPDLIFTSPPYHNLEHYSPEPTQSYLRYPEKDEWFEGFLKKVIERSYIDLVEDGYFVINVGNSMTSRTLQYAIKAGFVLKNSLILSLVSRSFLKHLNTNKEEIILFFKKEK